MLSTLSTVFTPDALAALWRGAQLTLSLTVLASIFGLILGLIAGLGRRSRLAPVRLLAGAYIETFRGTPLLVQLFFLFFALPQITGVSLPAFNTAVLGLSLFAGAYAAEIIRGSLNAVDRGQTEAARALGLKPWDILRLVLIPQAARTAVPALGNQFIGLLKDSSLASVITVSELLLTTRGLVSITYQPVPLYLAVALIYFLLSNVAARLFALLERRLNRPYRASAV
ncbi:His/Glu/Gln/Arg/opine family amino acid ABC transporter permease subunit [Deinococcus sp. HSC-46F16]|uniref:amino acid ABC transporter permease n=1 Tax=Deinococcus sp. HSC-46F16 TaxID=2910968 RepID=UPI00209CAF15|nr:amino acid ABC transporter permease [Deinococcus sp. HSC-46F16]MCP2013945.1 His/Glu/Gln/Arg/opine family amino acid ABC transporter permease subunit [Deinococcus sp. HSC-46F16]